MKPRVTAGLFSARRAEFGAVLGLFDALIVLFTDGADQRRRDYFAPGEVRVA